MKLIQYKHEIAYVICYHYLRYQEVQTPALNKLVKEGIELDQVG